MNGGDYRARSSSPARSSGSGSGGSSRSSSSSSLTRRMLILENFINGKFESVAETIDNVDPSTGSVYSRLPNSGSREVDKAVHAALQASTT